MSQPDATLGTASASETNQRPQIPVIWTISPKEKAGREISQLQEKMYKNIDYGIGGVTSPEIEARNKVIRDRFELRRAIIIARHGVTKEFVEPLTEEIENLKRMLTEKQGELYLLQRCAGHKQRRSQRSA